MTATLSPTERQDYQTLLAEYGPGLREIDALDQHEGDLISAVETLWNQSETSSTFGPGQKLWETLLKVLRQELCGNEGVRAQFQEYTKNPGSAPLLTGLIVSVTTAAGLPIDPAISTIVVLYLLKIGLNVFCEYTEPKSEPKPES